ncbi:FAD/NAD(P)-binding domain-containing protein, partial [Periconia macrospinosa]
MATQFKVLIIGGGIAGLSLAIILEAYGFDYELLEKHAEIAPKLGAGVGITPNGARILDQMRVWDEMCDYSSPVDAGTALSPEGQTVIFNPNMGDWLLKLFGYKIHFLSRHDCLRILLAKIQRKSCIHLRQEVVGIKTGAVGQRARAETKDGSVFTGDIVVGADGVRSTVREQLWKMADTERPGYIPKEDKTGIMSFYTAVIGVAHDPGLPEGGSARAYNHHRSYFFQEGRKGSREFYWWLCAKNETTKSGIIPKLSSEAKQQLLDRYADDRIGESLTLGSLSKMSTYSFIIPLQDFVLKKCFYKNIILIGDTFRKLHPVAGQGANSAIEESAFLADILWNLRATNAIHEPYALEQALEEFQRERFVRGKALQEDANLVQRMESLDNPVMKFMSLYVVPRLPFVVAFLPQLACSFIPARHLKHLPPPKQAMVAFSQDMKATISPRSNLATSFWAGTFILSALSPYMMSRFFGAEIERLAMDESAKLSGVVESYLAFIAISVSGVWVVESYKASFLISPLTSALVWILASNYWGWEKTVPLYFCLH